MLTENLSTLKINRLTQEQYDREKASGTLDDTALYFTPEEEIIVPTSLSQLSDDEIHRLVTDTDKTAWNAKYDKPSSGIPKTDLASDVQTSLAKADASAESFLVTFSITENSQEIIKNKTFAEIMAAYETGKTVLCKYLVYGSVSFGQLVDIYSDFNAVIFRVESYTHGSRHFSLVSVNSNDEITGSYFNLYFPTFSQYTILASGWSDGVYSFESDFPSWHYDIEIELDSTATESQVEAWSSAKVTAVFGTNTMKALGDVPTVDIPVIVKKVMK